MNYYEMSYFPFQYREPIRKQGFCRNSFEKYFINETKFKGTVKSITSCGEFMSKGLTFNETIEKDAGVGL